MRIPVVGAGSELASGMYRDLPRGLNVEFDQILGDLLVRARAVSVATPLLAAAFAHPRVCAGRLRRS